MTKKSRVKKLRKRLNRKNQETANVDVSTHGRSSSKNKETRAKAPILTEDTSREERFPGSAGSFIPIKPE